MAFDYLKSALSQDFIDKQRFGRLGEEREMRKAEFEEGMEERKTGRFAALAQMQEQQKVNEAKKQTSEFFLRINDVPIEGLKDKMTPDHIKYLSGIESLGDPEETRRAQNRVKFDILTRENPEILKLISAAYPETGQAISGILDKSELGGKAALSKQRHEEVIKEIQERTKGAVSRIKLTLKKKDTPTNVDEGLKAAQQIITALEVKATEPQKEEESDDAYMERLENINKRINDYIKFINDIRQDSTATLPSVEEELGNELPQEILDLFEEEEE